MNDRWQSLVEKMLARQKEQTPIWPTTTSNKTVIDRDYHSQMVRALNKAARPKPDPIKTLDTTDLIFELMERGFAVYKIPEGKTDGCEI